MGQYQGPARLEWWANASTCLAAYDVTVALEGGGADRITNGSGRVHLDIDVEIEAFVWLCGMDPVFLLCLPDGQEIAVVLDVDADRHTFSIAYYDGPPEREVRVTFAPDQ